MATKKGGSVAGVGKGTGNGVGTANAILAATHKLGQSIWYDNIRRGLAPLGRAARALSNRACADVTSNPTIFEKAIAGSSRLRGRAAAPGRRSAVDAGDLRGAVLDDIRGGCDVLLPVFESTSGVDGRVSLEVLPELAADTEQTVAEGLRLAHLVGRPNVMIKVPATPEGIPAVRALTAQGVSVNVTLIFSLDAVPGGRRRVPRRARATAWRPAAPRRAGLGRQLLRLARRRCLRQAAQARSRRAGRRRGRARVEALLGKIAIANAKLAYEIYQQTIAGARWKPLEAEGANPQRLLWASTGTKDPRYPDTLYVDALIGPDTVDTVPPATLDRVHRPRRAGGRAWRRSRGGAPADRGRFAALGLDLGRSARGCWPTA